MHLLWKTAQSTFQPISPAAVDVGVMVVCWLKAWGQGSLAWGIALSRASVLVGYKAFILTFCPIAIITWKAHLKANNNINSKLKIGYDSLRIRTDLFLPT